MFAWLRKRSSRARDNNGTVRTSLAPNQEIAKAESLIRLGRTDEANKILLSLKAKFKVEASVKPVTIDGYAKFIVSNYNFASVLKLLSFRDDAESVLMQLQNDKLYQALQQATRFGNDESENEINKIFYSVDILLNSIRRQNRRDNNFYTQAGFLFYACYNCGRLIGFISSPCPHCNYQSRSLEQISKSVCLSANQFSIKDLLVISREMAKGRTADDVVRNLSTISKELIKTDRANVEFLRKIVSERSEKRTRDMISLVNCPNCGDPIFLSNCEMHQPCGVTYSPTTIVRIGCCINNLLRCFEISVDAEDDRFGNFIASIIKMQSEILWNQRLPGIEEREVVLNQLLGFRPLTMENYGAIVQIAPDGDVSGKAVQEKITKEGYMRMAQFVGELDAFVVYMRTLKEL